MTIRPPYGTEITPRETPVTPIEPIEIDRLHDDGGPPPKEPVDTPTKIDV